MNPIKKYKKVEQIGKGSFGNIYKVMNRVSRNFLVLKEIDMTSMSRKSRIKTKNEPKILKQLNHPYVLKFEESFVHESKQTIYKIHKLKKTKKLIIFFELF
jgi:NIMA (never in mitosis gene a)-related kinase